MNDETETTYDCLMCGTPLLIRDSDLNQRWQCPVCGEIVFATKKGLGPDPLNAAARLPRKTAGAFGIFTVLALISLAIALFEICIGAW